MALTLQAGVPPTKLVATAMTTAPAMAMASREELALAVARVATTATSMSAVHDRLRLTSPAAASLATCRLSALSPRRREEPASIAVSTATTRLSARTPKSSRVNAGSAMGKATAPASARRSRRRRASAAAKKVCWPRFGFSSDRPGHNKANCTEPRMDVFPTGLPDMTADDAWSAMVAADKERDMDDFKTVRCRLDMTAC